MSTLFLLFFDLTEMFGLHLLRREFTLLLCIEHCLASFNGSRTVTVLWERDLFVNSNQIASSIDEGPYFFGTNELYVSVFISTSYPLTS
jgi:hypothetical protein